MCGLILVFDEYSEKASLTTSDTTEEQLYLQRFDVIPLSRGKPQIHLYTQEYLAPLLLDSHMYTSAIEKQLEFLQYNGRPFTCRLIPSNHNDCSFEIVELVANNTVYFSLSDYISAYKKDTIIGYVSVSLLFVLFLDISLTNFVLYTKAKKGLPYSRKEK